MKKNTKSINQMLAISIGFTIMLILIRIGVTKQLTYIFYLWNLFLAVVPLLISSILLKQHQMNIKTYLLLFIWIIFYPNAAYIVTDLFHYTHRPPVPFWYDLLIVISAAWNGLILALISLLQIELFLNKKLKPKIINLLILTNCILCGFGIYIGRFLRFNSWDIINNLDEVVKATIDRFIHPFQHPTTWGFTLLFGCMLALFFYTIKSINNYVHISNKILFCTK